MNGFQFSTQDYLAYLQMSGREHILVGGDERKRWVEGLVIAPHVGSRMNIFVDDVDHLVSFAHLYSNDEKVEHIFSSAIRCPYAHKLVRLVLRRRSESLQHHDSQLVPIDDRSSITERVNEVMDQVLSKGIRTTHPSDVRSYLLQHIDLIDLLPFVARVASEGFGSATQLSLELYRDPEVEDVYLAIFARNEQYDEKFLEVMKAIRASYTDLLTGKSGWILVTTDFDIPHEGE